MAILFARWALPSLRLLLAAMAAATVAATETGKSSKNAVPQQRKKYRFRVNPHKNPNDLQNRPKKDRIVGGNRVEKDRYPYVVPIVDKFGQFCGGSLIADNAVLTAAHCMVGNRIETIQVRVGSDLARGGQAYNITNGYEHPMYDGSTDKFDLYIMILENRVTDVAPVTVNPDGAWPKPDTKARSMGWGLTTEGGRGSPILLEVDLDVISNDQCKAADADYAAWILEDMICTQTEAKDACQGDSGGPLVVPDKKYPPVPEDDTLFGIVSWGVGCARMPGVFARTSAAYDWIVQKVCDDNNGGGPLCGASKVVPLAPNPASSTGETTPTPGPPGPTVTAVYDENFKAPKCATVGTSCVSGNLLEGTGANVEPNAPNTLDGCADPARGDYKADESIQAIKVSAIKGSSRLEKGGMAQIEATVFAYKDGSEDEADFFYSRKANKPSWTYIGTAKPSGGGIQKLKVEFQIPMGGKLQAVRVNFRNGGRMNHCSDGRFDERDDLVYAVDGVKEDAEELTSWQAFRGPQFSTDEKPNQIS